MLHAMAAYDTLEAHLLQPAFKAIVSISLMSAFPYPLPRCAGREARSATYKYLRHGSASGGCTLLKCMYAGISS